jgi:hypothetical protein
VDLFIENGPGHVDNKFLVFLEVGAVHKVSIGVQSKSSKSSAKKRNDKDSSRQK